MIDHTELYIHLRNRHEGEWDKINDWFERHLKSRECREEKRRIAELAHKIRCGYIQRTGEIVLTDVFGNVTRVNVGEENNA